MAIRQRDVGSPVVCRHCHRVLLPVPVRQAPASASTAEAAVRSYKNCPHCAERILEAARKCRYCDEPLNKAPDGDSEGQTSPEQQVSNQAIADDARKIEFVYRVSTSQWDNFFKYLVCLIVATLAAGVYLIPTLRPYASIVFGSVLIIDFIVIFLIYFGTRSSRCLVGPDRVELHAGVFTRQIDWISLASIQDMQLRQGFIQRALNIGTIMIKSMDETTPLLELYQIPKAGKIFCYIQEQVSRLRRLPR